MPGEPPFRIVGRYELHGELAAGGMATVHLGRSIGAAGFAKSVAIKRLHAHFARDPEFVSLLLEEARLSERIRHPNVVATLDVVAAEHELLLVMEYVHGETLARLLRACGQDGQRCPPEIAASIAHAVLLGLHAAHTATDVNGAPLCIVHRDVSPQNIIVGADGVARLLDFGIAKAAGAASHTREGEVKGKLPYMAPEILKGEQATPQSDLYGAAVTLWESLCARRLFRADSEIGLWATVLEGEVPLPSTIAGPLGPVEQVVMRGLARAKSDRYTTALDMAQALARSIRLASSAEIAAWIATRAADALAERSATVRAIEQTSPHVRSAAIAPPPSPAVPAAAPTPQAARRWERWALLAMVAMTAIGLVVFLRGEATRRANAREATPATPAAAEPSVATAAAPAEGAETAKGAEAPAPPSTGIAAAAASAAGEEAPSGGVRPSRASPVRGKRAAPPATSARARGAPDPCDPPYTLDEAGRKHFKLSCVN